MNTRALILFALSAGALAAPQPARKPNFECSDAQGSTYTIWLTDEKRALQVTEQGHVREIPLSGAKLGRRPKGEGEPLIYNGWKEGGGFTLYEMLDLSNEFLVHYVKKGGKTKVEVSIVVDHREKGGLKCKARGFAAEVVAAGSDTPASKRYAALVVEGAGLRTVKGTLSAIGVLLVEAGVRRMYESPDYKNETLRSQYIGSVAEALRNVEESSINRVDKQLPKPIGAFWQTILTTIRYKYYPEVSRFAAWVKEGARPGLDRDLDSVVAGFTELSRSHDNEVKELRAFFLAEVTPVLKGLTEDDAALVNARLAPAAAPFFMEQWARAAGQRTLASYPEVASQVKEISTIVDAKELDPQKLVDRLAVFLKSSVAADPDSRAIFIEAASAQLKKLTDRQREDVIGWLESDAEKKLFQELVH